MIQIDEPNHSGSWHDSRSQNDALIKCNAVVNTTVPIQRFRAMHRTLYAERFLTWIVCQVRRVLTIVSIVSILLGSVRAQDFALGARRQSLRPVTVQDAAGSSPARLTVEARRLQPRHGGNVSATKWHYFEVVYTPYETWIYVYSPFQEPVNPSRSYGEAIVRMKGDPNLYRFPVGSVIDGYGMGCLSAAIDVRNVRDGDMQVLFDLQQLPFAEEPQAQFQQMFALTLPPVMVRPLSLTESDRGAVARQRFCPVNSALLGDNQVPRKLAVGQQVIYVCGDKCAREVQHAPQRYLERVASNAHNLPTQLPRPRVVTAGLSQHDEPAIRAQAVCPVSNQRLGAHGRPMKLLVDGMTLYVCSQNCRSHVEQWPDFYVQHAGGRRAQPPLSTIASLDDPIQTQVVASFVSPADDTAVRRQRKCPVNKQPLGSRGRPLKVSAGGETLYVCSRRCADQVKRRPLEYFDTASERGDD